MQEVGRLGFGVEVGWEVRGTQQLDKHHLHGLRRGRGRERGEDRQRWREVKRTKCIRGDRGWKEDGVMDVSAWHM